ncbi:hypothetical protein M758_3G203800 [Ceratodon purpureus]|nr:hypothetical protein M758_3G203800 [Ceratodon purpureus]
MLNIFLLHILSLFLFRARSDLHAVLVKFNVILAVYHMSGIFVGDNGSSAYRFLEVFVPCLVRIRND